MELLILSFLVAGLFVRNTAQDIVYKKLRGEDPPYLVRRREREARRAGRPAPAERGPARRFLADAWEDAWEDAREKRARTHAKKRDQRREGWAERDTIDAIEDEAWKANRERDKAQPDGDGQPRDTWEPAPIRCEACHKKITEKEVTLVTIDGQQARVCPDCATSAGAGGNPPKQPGPSTGNAPEGDTPNPDAPKGTDHKGDQDGATVTQMDDWRNNPASDSTQEEHDLSVNGETTNLSAALTYTTEMASRHDQAASSAETSIASLTAGGVTGETITHMAQAQELEGQAAAAYRAAHDALARHIQVREAYHANQDAGSKEFVSQD